MPIYNYICNACSAEFEKEIPYGDMSFIFTQVRCPECRSRKVRKKISKPAIIFKGDGFTLSNKESEKK